MHQNGIINKHMRDFTIVHDFYFMLFLPFISKSQAESTTTTPNIVFNVIWYFMKCCGDSFGDASYE